SVARLGASPGRQPVRLCANASLIDQRRRGSCRSGLSGRTTAGPSSKGGPTRTLIQRGPYHSLEAIVERPLERPRPLLIAELQVVRHVEHLVGAVVVVLREIARVRRIEDVRRDFR